MNNIRNYYNVYPYLRSTITECIYSVFLTEIKRIKRKDVIEHNFNELIKLCYEIKLFHIEIVKVLLNLLLVDSLLVYNNIC